MNPPTTDRSSAGRAGLLRRVLGADKQAAKTAAGDGDSPAGEDGFTLTEVIVSIALFTVVSFAVMMALVTLVKLTGVTQNRVVASNLARQEVEKLRGQNSTLSLLDAAASTVKLKGTTFTITPILNPAASATCTPGASRNVTVKVSWNDSSNRSVRYDTVLSC
ncbi:type IV pilus modification PilV family protein [Jatrophihabitans sp.]|uniref:type IV pilus modification PilV family protein n=1 Tax=Jatrophihabitans sp. TaxID=1932789 RepID=UPI002B701043|nr:prepilin-type N-terminal cleavage/methylation domain-containing protein [Jatrophihabitans sp.]